MGVRFDYNQRGGVTVDRESLHATPEYKRQVAAMDQLFGRKSVMGEKMSLEQVRLQMAQACTIGSPVPARFVADWLLAVNAHLSQPAQAVAFDVVDEDGGIVAGRVDRAYAEEVVRERWQDKLTILPLYRALSTAQVEVRGAVPTLPGGEGVMGEKMELIQQLRGRAAFLRDKGRIKSPQLMEQAADTLEAGGYRQHVATEPYPRLYKDSNDGN